MSIDISKMKINLKLALNRMKIQKNKKHNEIKSGRRAIAELLKNGKEEVARVKVEGVIRDELLLEAFEILDLFVELLLSRIEMMKMQSGCPFDLKEAVCTVIYAAPRMDVKELTEVRSMFIQKYGKPFASEAMENKGSCVNAKVIHKMSIVTPETCHVFDCLGSIAKEYNIDWVSPLSASPDEMGMFPAPPGMAAPLQPQYAQYPYQQPGMNPHMLMQQQALSPSQQLLQNPQLFAQQPYPQQSQQFQPQQFQQNSFPPHSQQQLQPPPPQQQQQQPFMFPAVPQQQPSPYNPNVAPPPYQPTYEQQHQQQHQQQPYNPNANQHPQNITPGNPNDASIDDLMARFNNLKK